MKVCQVGGHDLRWATPHSELLVFTMCQVQLQVPKKSMNKACYSQSL